MSKIGQILDVVRGSEILPVPMGEYHIAAAIRDANRCRTNSDRFSAARRATARTRLIVTLDSGMGTIRVRNNETAKEYTLHP